MKNAEVTRLSSRGQVVIPQWIREKMGLKRDDVLACRVSGKQIILEKIEGEK